MIDERHGMLRLNWNRSAISKDIISTTDNATVIDDLEAKTINVFKHFEGEGKNGQNHRVWSTWEFSKASDFKNVIKLSERDKPNANRSFSMLEFIIILSIKAKIQ